MSYHYSEEQLAAARNHFETAQAEIIAGLGILANGKFEAFTKPPTSQAPNIDGIDWWVKEKDTGKNRPANLEYPYAWTFAALKDGTIPEGRKALLAHLDRYGKAEIQGFEIIQSKDGKFLQRKKSGGGNNASSKR